MVSALIYRCLEVSSPNGTIPALLPPHNLIGVPPFMGAVPSLGEHTEQVLAELRECECYANAALLNRPLFTTPNNGFITNSA